MAKCAICGKKLGLFDPSYEIFECNGQTVCDSCNLRLETLTNSQNPHAVQNAIKYFNQYPDMDSSCADYIASLNEKAEKNVKTYEKEEMLKNRYKSVVVTTCDLHEDYEILGPVYFQTSNKGIFSSALSDLIKQYQNDITEMKNRKLMSQERADWGFLVGAGYAGQNEFEKAFYVSIQEMRKRCAEIGGDAIIGLRQDIDMDTTGFQFFYLQMYGTAVKRKPQVNSGNKIVSDVPDESSM